MSEYNRVIDSRLVMNLMVKLIEAMSHEDTVMNPELSQSLADASNIVNVILNEQIENGN